MAIGATRGAGVRPGSVPQVISGSAHGTWQVVNDDARTAQGTTTNLYNPTGITDSTFHWCKVPQGTTGVHVRGRVPIATTAVGTSPVVALVGAIDTTPTDDPAGVTDGTIRVLRFDSVGIADAGLTLTFPASPTTTTCQCDATWFYSATPSLSGYDMKGAKWVGVVVMTAGACTASAAMPIDLLFLN